MSLSFLTVDFHSEPGQWISLSLSLSLSLKKKKKKKKVRGHDYAIDIFWRQNRT